MSKFIINSNISSNTAVQINSDDFDRFTEAVDEAAKLQIKHLAQHAIKELQNLSATEIFGSDIAARDLWDEYSWNLIEGPYDSISLAFGGSVHDMLLETANIFILHEVEQLPCVDQMLLSLYAYQHDDCVTFYPDDETVQLGIIYKDGIATLVLECLNQMACQRNLDLIGPDRSDVATMYISLSGPVGEALKTRGQASELLAEHIDIFLQPTPEDIKELGETVLQLYLEAFYEDLKEAEHHILEVLEMNEEAVKTMLLNDNIIPMLEEIADDVAEILA